MAEILYIIDTLERGGKERRLSELLKYFASSKEYSISLIILNGIIKYDEIFQLNIKIYNLNFKGRNVLSTLERINSIIKISLPSVIHVWSSTSALFAIPFSIGYGIPLINGMISTAPEKIIVFSKLWLKAKLTFPFSTQIVSNTHAGLVSFKAPSRKSLFIHNGFDFKRLEQIKPRNETRNVLGLDGFKVVGMVANFTQNKDYHTLLKAAKLIQETRKDILFVAIGDGSNFNKCKHYAKTNNIENIKFLGRQTQVESIINCFDIGVMLTNSKVHGEGISNSIMECMALGKPVIATDSGGNREIIIHGETGFLVPDFNVEEVVKNIVMLLSNVVLLNKMGKQAHQRIIENFNNRLAESQYEKLYQSVFANQNKT